MSSDYECVIVMMLRVRSKKNPKSKSKDFYDLDALLLMPHLFVDRIGCVQNSFNMYNVRLIEFAQWNSA